MRINPITNNINFKGYDARKLKAIAVTDVGYDYEIGKQLDAVAKQNGFALETLNNNELRPLSYCFEPVLPDRESLKKMADYNNANKNSIFKIIVNPHIYQPPIRGFKNSDNTTKWAQDIATVTLQNTVLAKEPLSALGIKIADKYWKRYIPETSNHIAGGNLFFMSTDEGEKVLLGQNEKIKYRYKTPLLYANLGTTDIIYVPQMDYHLDLFIRPLDDGRVLLANDDLTMDMFANGIKTFREIENNTADMNVSRQLVPILDKLGRQRTAFERAISENINPKYDKVERVLKNNGFTPIPVPARIYSTHENTFLIHKTNYINAIVTLNDNGELVYITNKSDFDKNLGITPEIESKYGFSTEKTFVDSISDYVKKENIHFISGKNDAVADMLRSQYGGIHCLACEIPE